MLAKRCGVLIKKGITTSVTKVIFEHEIPVLNFKYGAGNITRIDIPRFITSADGKHQLERGTLRFPITEIEHDEEYNRLMVMYAKHNEQDRFVNEMAYGYIDERRMEILNEAKYRPMIAADHSFVPMPKIPEADFDDGLTVFDDIPVNDNPEGEDKLPPHSESPLVPETVKQAAPVEPLTDLETMLKIENMTKDGIMELLEGRGIPHNPNDNKDVLHALYMDSMKPVGVDMGDGEDES